jgi:hypothetical protein
MLANEEATFFIKKTEKETWYQGFVAFHDFFYKISIILSNSLSS